MNERMAAAYAARPKRWVFELAVAAVVLVLLVWSASAVGRQPGPRRTRGRA